MKRTDGRTHDELRSITLQTDFIEYPEGSVLIHFGNTQVLCNVSIEEKLPSWKRSGHESGGWVTAEYALLPRSTHQRTPRETSGLRGRTQEIRRMIGRSLRAAVNLTALGPRTCIVDCDVLQADGGTRTAAVTGGYAALEIALKKHIADGSLPRNVLRFPVAAVSVGMAAGQPMVDLTYEEDFHADVDLNIVMDEKGRYIEIQGTAEGAPFYPRDLDAMVKLASNSIADLFKIQRSALEGEA